MSSFGEKFRALLATGRVANLPTVWSNVLMAYFLAFACQPSDQAQLGFLIFTLGLGAISASFLYLGGCLLGDCIDLEFDKNNRPSRPLPTGVLNLSSTRTLAIAGLILGTFFGLMTPLTPLLAVLIASYACFHKKFRSWALLNMALCRATLVLFGVSLTTHQWVQPSYLFIAFIIGLYTMGLSAVAATESDSQPFGPRKLLFVGMLALPLIGILLLKNQGAFHQINGLITFTVGAYLAWMIYSFSILSHSKPAFVSRALAGFCLLDASIAATFSLPITLICLGLFGLALLLQKITPAT